MANDSQTQDNGQKRDRSAGRSRSRITVSAFDANPDYSVRNRDLNRGRENPSDTTPRSARLGDEHTLDMSVASNDDVSGTGIEPGQRLGDGNNPGGSVDIGLGSAYGAEEGRRLRGASMIGGGSSFNRRRGRDIGSNGLRFSRRVSLRTVVVIVACVAVCALLAFGVSSCVGGCAA